MTLIHHPRYGQAMAKHLAEPWPVHRQVMADPFPGHGRGILEPKPSYAKPWPGQAMAKARPSHGQPITMGSLLSYWLFSGFGIVSNSVAIKSWGRHWTDRPALRMDFNTWLSDHRRSVAHET